MGPVQKSQTTSETGMHATADGSKIPSLETVLFSLRTAALNLMRLAGFQSIREGLQAVK